MWIKIIDTNKENRICKQNVQFFILKIRCCYYVNYKKDLKVVVEFNF